MVDTKKVENPDIKSLEDISKLVKKLVKEHSSKEVVEKSGVDKNVIYRLEHEQNVTLDNYLKIKNAFPQIFKGSQNGQNTGSVPIVGQIIEGLDGTCTVKPLNPSQPKEWTAPITLIKRFAPVYAYLYISKTGYHSCVQLFTTSEIRYQSINEQCIDRIIMAFDEASNVHFGTCHAEKDTFQIRGTVNQEVILSIPIENKVSWARWIALLPFSMMEHNSAHKSEDLKLAENNYNLSVLHKISHK